ncbi:zinc ribbon domain-containing protein [Campylobacter sp. MG1]|uniref:zinc ribbon domain-containing protein n=1 Tax=Campylobacter sp. MG1 TaxID=2976332 RepID=UPI00226CBB22|nr:C4-type zinc ribbon domain-containing protein [Campylobacter sp. MG1]
MNKHLSQLIELSKLDKEIDSFLPQIESVKRESILLEEQIKHLEHKNNKLENVISEINESKVRVDNHIAQFSNKINDIAKKVNLVKSNKEIEALKLEEEIAREQLYTANLEIERLDKLLSSKNEEIQENNKQISILKDNLLIAINNQKSSLDAIEEKRKNIYVKKDSLASEIDSKVFSFYEKIRKWAKNTSVVPVKKQACYGCFMQLNSKTYSLVLKGDDIINCPHCGRILYIEE